MKICVEVSVEIRLNSSEIIRTLDHEVNQIMHLIPRARHGIEGLEILKWSEWGCVCGKRKAQGGQGIN